MTSSGTPLMSCYRQSLFHQKFLPDLFAFMYCPQLYTMDWNIFRFEHSSGKKKRNNLTIQKPVHMTIFYMHQSLYTDSVLFIY
jgi:hypothetical protein